MKPHVRISARTLEYLVGILATALIAVGLLLYALDEPQRIARAQQAQLALDLDEAMTLYAENCAVCHGMAGKGIGATPGLDNPGLATMSADDLFKVIARGRFNTAMPAWSLEDGGPLGDYQISELVTLIQFGDWSATQERVVNLGLAPKIPFAVQPDAAVLEQVRSLPQGETLAQGVTLYAEYCVACHGADGLGTALAPALNDPLVGQKTANELERMIQNGIPATLMAGWSGVLTTEQIAALTQLIQRWEEVPDGALPAPNQPAPVTAESLALGAQLYSQACARCHGPDGQGTPRAPALNVLGFLQDINDSAMQQIITLGVPATAMPAWGDRMTEAEIQAIVGFIRSWEPTAPQVAQPLRGPWWRISGSAPALPSGGVNPDAAASQKQGAQGKLGGAAQHTGVSSGQPPDNRAIALIAALMGIAVAFSLIGVRGLRRAAATGD